MALLPLTGLETHPAGTTNVAGIINANWSTLEAIAAAKEWARPNFGETAYAASVALDFASGPENVLIELGGNITITFSNLAAGKRVGLWIRSVGNRTLSWPSGITWLNAASPASIGPNKALKIEFFCKSPTGPDVFAIVHLQP